MTTLLAGATVTSLRLGATQLASIGATILISRLLGPEGKGVYTVAMLIPSFAVTLGNFGIGTAVAYHLRRGEYPAIGLFTAGLALISLASLVGMLLSSWVATHYFPSFLKELPLSYVIIAAGFIPAELLRRYSESTLLGLQRILSFNLSALLSGVSFLVIVWAALELLGAKVTYTVAARVLSSLLASLIALSLVVRATGGIRLQLRRQWIGAITSYGTRVYLGNVVTFLNYRIDILLLGLLLDPVFVGYYSVAVALAERIKTIGQAPGIVLFPRIAGEKSDSRRCEITGCVARISLAVTIVAGMALLPLSKVLVIGLFSKAYIPALRPFRILLPGVIVVTHMRILTRDLAARGFPTVSGVVGIVGLAANVALNFVLIPRLQADGAAIASVVSYGSMWILTLSLYCRKTGSRLRQVLFMRGSDILVLKRSLMKLLNRR